MFSVRRLQNISCTENLFIMYSSKSLTLNLLTTTIVALPSNASKWQMGFNSAFKGLNTMSSTGYKRNVLSSIFT